MLDTEVQELQQTYGPYCAAIVGRILDDPRDQEEAGIQIIRDLLDSIE